MESMLLSEGADCSRTGAVSIAIGSWLLVGRAGLCYSSSRTKDRPGKGVKEFSMRSLMLISVLGFVLSGCSLSLGGKEVAKVGDGGGASDSYDLTSYGCSTGKHEFSGSPEDVNARVCSALQDEETNHGCAQDLRADLFKEKCPGQTFKPKYQWSKTSDDKADAFLLNVNGLTEAERAEASSGLAELLERE